MALTNIFNYFTGKTDSRNESNNAFFDSVEHNEYHGDNEVQMEKREPGELTLLDIKLNEKEIDIESVDLSYKKTGDREQVYKNVYGFDFEIIGNSYRKLVLKITNIYEYADEYSKKGSYRRNTPAFELWRVGQLTKGDYITLDLNLDKPFNHKFENNNTRHMYHIIDNVISQTKSIKATITPKGQYRYHPTEEDWIKRQIDYKKDQAKAREDLKSRPQPGFRFGSNEIWKEHQQKHDAYGHGKYKQNNTKSKKSKKSSSRRTSSRKKNKKKGKSNK